jgi:hypothetical protein
MRGLRRLFVVSMALAALAFLPGAVLSIPAFSNQKPIISAAFSYCIAASSFVLGLAWCTLVAVGFRFHGWRAAGLLVGAPLALFWPALTLIIAIGCYEAGACL